jgi:integrase
MFALFLKYSKTNNSAHQYKQNIHKVNLFENFFGCYTKIIDITPNDIEELKQYLFEKGLKNSSINRYYSSLSKAFNLIIVNKRLGIINPCKCVSKLKEDNKITRYLTKAEEERLFKVLPQHIKPIITCALTTGLRLSNILNLKWESIDFNNNFIEILKQENKGHKEIRVPLGIKLKNTFEEIGIKECGYVFINKKTGLPYTTIKKSFNTALKNAKIKNFRFHDLRHTVGTRLIANGADIQTVKEYLAHSDLRTTQRYIHSVSENMKRAVDILDSF